MRLAATATIRLKRTLHDAGSTVNSADKSQNFKWYVQEPSLSISARLPRKTHLLSPLETRANLWATSKRSLMTNYLYSIT